MQVIGVSGPSNAGKTTLVEALVERLSERGTVGTVKHVDCEPTLDTDPPSGSRCRPDVRNRRQIVVWDRRVTDAG